MFLAVSLLLLLPLAYSLIIRTYRPPVGLSTCTNGMALNGKITPNQGENMDQYRKSIMKVLKEQSIDNTKLGGRELLNLMIKKWGVAYDIQLRKLKPFGDGSENIYVNVMWRYFGQQSFPMDEREYLEHLEAIGRYITSLDMVDEFKEKVSESRKRPNAYFGYAVSIPLNVDPSTADKFFKDLEYD
jgi:hypothetical protein